MGIWESWQEVTVAVLSLAFLLIAFVYMVGVGFRLPRVQAWAKNEFYQAVANCIIAGGMLVLISSLNGLTNSITGSACTGGLISVCNLDYTIRCPVSCSASRYPEFCCPEGSGGACPGYAKLGGYSAAFDHAKCYIDSNRNDLLNSYVTFLGANIALGILFSWHQYFAPYQQGITISLFPGLMTITDFIGVIMMFVAGGAILLLVNSIVLDFLRFKLMALLPIGIALRSFPFSRGAGAGLIAIVAGFYVVYPMLFFLDSLIFMNDTSNFAALMGCSQPGDFFGWFGYIGCLINSGLNRPIYSVFIVGIFLPLFNLTLTLTFTRELAKLLGGDLDLSSLTKLL